MMHCKKERGKGRKKKKKYGHTDLLYERKLTLQIFNGKRSLYHTEQGEERFLSKTTLPLAKRCFNCVAAYKILANRDLFSHQHPETLSLTLYDGVLPSTRRPPALRITAVCLQPVVGSKRSTSPTDRMP